jgi:hypothetical protein
MVCQGHGSKPWPCTIEQPEEQGQPHNTVSCTYMAHKHTCPMTQQHWLTCGANLPFSWQACAAAPGQCSGPIAMMAPTSGLLGRADRRLQSHMKQPKCGSHMHTHHYMHNLSHGQPQMIRSSSLWHMANCLLARATWHVVVMTPAIGGWTTNINMMLVHKHGAKSMHFANLCCLGLRSIGLRCYWHMIRAYSYDSSVILRCTG